MSPCLIQWSPTNARLNVIFVYILSICIFFWLHSVHWHHLLVFYITISIFIFYVDIFLTIVISILKAPSLRSSSPNFILYDGANKRWSLFWFSLTKTDWCCVSVRNTDHQREAEADKERKRGRSIFDAISRDMPLCPHTHTCTHTLSKPVTKWL